ncbi:hypothetical protein HJC23_009278 [Cyclotella cryptica]|uniref:ribonuclease P n=1 Tax=Cyclotella cryptica TaxID=29204 RepID=A0ABD3NKP6_9STRA
MSDASITKCDQHNKNDDEAAMAEIEPPALKKKKTEESRDDCPASNDAPNDAAPSTSTGASPDSNNDNTNTDNVPSTHLPPLLDLTTTTTTTTHYITFHKSYKPPNKKSTKHLAPPIVSTRRQIQLCCRNNDLPTALDTLRHAMEHDIYLEPQSLYNLLNLCEGSFGERERMGRVHVGTPRRGPRRDDEAGRGGEGAEAVGTVEMEDDNVVNGNEQQTNTHLPKSTSPIRQLHPFPTESIEHTLYRTDVYGIDTSRHPRGDLSRAEAYLDEAEGTQQCKVKLRMYSALIRGYCGDYGKNNDDEVMREEGLEGEEEGGGGGKDLKQPTREDLVKALKVWVRMYHHSGGSRDVPTDSGNNNPKDEEPILFGEGISPKINLTEIEYSSLMKCATALHDVPVMERVLSDLAERVLVPGLETTETVLNWFRRSKDVSATEEGEYAPSALEQVTLPPREGISIGSVWNENGKGWMIYHGCAVNAKTGELTMGRLEGESSVNGNDEQKDTVSSFKLKPVELSDKAWEEMRRMNQAIVLEGQVEGHVSQFQGGGKGKKRPRGHGGGNGANVQPVAQKAGNNHHHQTKRGNEWRIKVWQQFETFLQNHPPYDTVIDGANVGYFQQNFSNAPKHVDYKQIDWLLRHLLEGSTEGPRPWDGNHPPYDRLTVYRTPGGMNDDWYWMHAALLHGGKNNSPSPPPVLAVTNDEMRDHHFQMLAQGSFLRWKERHQIHFDFGAWNKRLGRREVLLRYPSAYSRRIQRLKTDDDTGNHGEEEAIVIPLPKKGDEGRYVDGVHDADESAPEEETYVVIRRVK